MMIKARVIRMCVPAILLAGMVPGASPALLQGQTPVAEASQSVTKALLDKARLQEAHGRRDLAVQTWQQVLLTEPRNPEALANLARVSRLVGDSKLADSYQKRLRAISPNGPTAASAERVTPPQDQKALLQQATKLSEAGKYVAAMMIYRQVFGTSPPAGGWALAYYETESSTDGGRAHAVEGLRALVRKYPSEAPYQISLGRLLTYNPATREEGRKYLEAFPKDPQATLALRQSLLWDAANPAVAPQIRAYLATHQDPQLAAVFQVSQPAAKSVATVGNQATSLETPARPPPVPVVKPTKPASGTQSSASPTAPVAPALPTIKASVVASPAAPVPTRTRSPTRPSEGQTTRARMSDEIAAYNALNANRIGDAETRFKAVLAGDPHNVKALAGMGFVRMQQGNFLGAISFLEEAKRSNVDEEGVQAALDTSQFWFHMGEGQDALTSNELTKAEKNYRAAVQLRPNNPEAFEGLAGTLLRAQQPLPAISLFEHAVQIEPASSSGWRGLFMAHFQGGDATGALGTVERIPPAPLAQLMTDPLFLQPLASAYAAVGRGAEARSTLESALKQPFPSNVKGLKADIQRQLAGMLASAAQPSIPSSDAEIENAWLLYNNVDDNGLYRQLMTLGGRRDLTAEQRRTVQAIWTNWAARRAMQATAAGNPRRALAILNAAATAFPDNPAAIKALAIGYAQASQPHQAYLIYKAQNMTSASAADYEVAVGAALADGENKDAGIWLRYALAANPTDPQILLLAAKFEETRGDSARAIKYYQASLKAMPPVTPASRLAAEVGLPALSTPSSLPSADRPQDLPTLLAPGSTAPTPAGGTSTEPYLPSYGISSPLPPYNGTTPLMPPVITNPVPPNAAVGEASSPTAASVAPPSVEPIPDDGQRTATQPAVAVQLGDNTPHPMQSQSEVTDVLPTARYSPSERANQAAASHAEVAAARAARIRRLQQDSSAARTGQNPPPPESPAPAQSVPQVAQPSSPPQRQPDNLPDTGAHRYPQPSSPPSSTASVPPQPQFPPPTPPNAATTAPELTHSIQPVLPTSPPPPPPSDAELTARNLPPLGGDLEAQVPIPITQRQHAESELASLEASYSGWLGATGIGRYRSGTAGLDRLYEVEAPAEASAVIARSTRLTIVALPVFLNSGLLNNLSFGTGNIPYLGTLAANSPSLSAQQFSNGIGGELQLTTRNLGLAVGYTPYEFLVHNFTGRAQWSAFSRHVSLYGERQPIKDTQLSYAGLHDPATTLAASQSPVWGGVISSAGGIQLQFGSTSSSFHISAEGGVLTGQHVLDNHKFGGATAANFRVANWPDHGSLTLGGSLSGMHYAFNESGLSYGQGGYFSPSMYFLASVPVRLNGRYKANFHYVLEGSLGVQTFQQDAALFYPLDPSLQTAFVPSNGAACLAIHAPSYNCGEYPLTDTTAFNYAFNSEVSYRFGEHWYGGGLVSAGNARNYNTVSAGFFLRYVFRAQQSPAGYPAGLFSVDGLRPLQIP